MPAEIVEVSSPAGSIGPGPSDERMYVVFPLDKALEYGLHRDAAGNPFVYLPPWDGLIHEPAIPDAYGDFLQYEDVEDPCFHAAHTFGAIRFTLDIWEEYYGRQIPWYFDKYFETAEVVIIPEFENAQIGRGFIEIGSNIDKKSGIVSPFTFNFDVIAHEIGHGLIFTEMGEPDPDKETAEYLGFQESSADIVSMIAILHFDSVITDVLDSTSGNLYMANHLNRFAEISPVDQIRMACNSLKLSDFEMGWKSAHRLSQPLTGAVFDIFVDIFHEELVRLGAISISLEQISDKLEGTTEYEVQLQDDFEYAYAVAPTLFREALKFSRDTLAKLMIGTWARLSANYLRYTYVHESMLKADNSIFGGQYRTIVDVNFLWRNIGTAIVGPRLPKDEDEEPEPIGHKDKKHKLSGLNEDRNVSIDEAHNVYKNNRRRESGKLPYATRHRYARADKKNEL
ncbi:hypothetical protein OAM69_03100 [bacterium]|nr:hypothetical protein [bacterium]MDC0434611.1 hypothetical protein [bacterium]